MKRLTVITPPPSANLHGSMKIAWISLDLILLGDLSIPRMRTYRDPITGEEGTMCMCYDVPMYVILTALANKNPLAGRWWREHTHPSSRETFYLPVSCARNVES